MASQVIDTILTSGWREGAANATALQVRDDSIGRMAPPQDIPAPRGPALLAPPPDEDPQRLAVGGWAAVVLEEDLGAAREALAPLIRHRGEQGYLWGDGIIPVSRSTSDTTSSWWRRFLRAVGEEEPPFYLLLVGGPDRFPFAMQYELDLQRATGRLDASDTPGENKLSWEGCRRYAEKVVAYERGEIAVEAQPLFYSLSCDTETSASHKYLVKPLTRKIPGGVTELYGAQALTANLLDALSAEVSPKLVFTASHGVEYPAEAVRWGALTDASYRGRAGDTLVSAEAVAGSERFAHGAIIFSFACFSAGVPDHSALSFLTGKADEVETMPAQVSPLPRQLLGHARGPVAFVGHVDRVTAVAFQSSYGMAGISPYRDFVGWLRFTGGTLGQALGTIRENARVTGTQVANALEYASREGSSQDSVRDAGRRWVGFHDYRGFLLLGDPGITPVQQ